jgi:hypothetical protein
MKPRSFLERIVDLHGLGKFAYPRMDPILKDTYLKDIITYSGHMMPSIPEEAATDPVLVSGVRICSRMGQPDPDAEGWEEPDDEYSTEEL